MLARPASGPLSNPQSLNNTNDVFKATSGKLGHPFLFHLPPCSLEEALTQPDSSSFDPRIPTSSVKQNGYSLSIILCQIFSYHSTNGQKQESIDKYFNIIKPDPQRELSLITGTSYKKNLQQDWELEVFTGRSRRVTADLGQQPVAANTSSSGRAIGCFRVCRQAHILVLTDC